MADSSFVGYTPSPSTYNPGQTVSPIVRRVGPSLVRPDEKKLEDITRWIKKDKDRWEKRNQRFRRDQQVYQLKKPDTLFARSEADILILNDPKVLVKKVARLIARHPPNIEVVPSPGVMDESIAQRIENYLYAYDQSLNQKYMMGLNNPYRYDQSFYMVLRGWLCERTLLYPDGVDDMSVGDHAALYDHRVVDPALVYPYVAGGRIIRVIHSYKITVGELKSDPYLYNDQKWLDNMDDYTMIDCDGVYWMDDVSDPKSWQHAVAARGHSLTARGRDNEEWIKKPQELGYNPWTIVIGNGAAYRGTPWEWDEYIEEIGTGVLDESADTFRYLNRVATKLNELLSLEANPPASLFMSQGEIKELSLFPGGRNYFGERDKIELHRV